MADPSTQSGASSTKASNAVVEPLDQQPKESEKSSRLKTAYNKAKGLTAWAVRHPFMPLAVGLLSATALCVTRSYTPDPTARNFLHVGVIGAGELVATGILGAGFGSWIQRVDYNRTQWKKTGQRVRTSSTLTKLKRTAFWGAIIFVGVPALVGQSHDPFLNIPSNILKLVGMRPLNVSAEKVYEQAMTIPVSSTTIQNGERVSIQMSNPGFTYAADKNGNPDQLNRYAVPAGDGFCAIGTNGDFFKVVIPGGGAPVFVRKYMTVSGGDACAEIPALPQKQGAIVRLAKQFG